MSISSLRLQNFRSYKDAQFDFSDQVNIVVGPNASGKTNLLEAVLVLSLGKSYRVKDQELISIGATWSRLDATHNSQERTIKIETEPAVKKSYIIDGKNLSRLITERTIPVVLFEPNHLFLFNGGPELRRAYLDDLLEQIEPTYSSLRRNYRRTLSQRNALLKQGLNVAGRQIFPWNLKLSQLGGQIARQRQDLINQLNQNASQIYSQISATPYTVRIEYDSQWHHENYETHMLKKLEGQLDLDVQRGFTTAGPHRDDMLVYINDMPADSTASRGEIRSLVLACKIMELKMVADARGQNPIFLLDDVFSELDAKRRKALVGFLKDHQTMITTTDADVVKGHFKTVAKLIDLSAN